MIYFSEIARKKIISEDGVEIGRLEDIVFLATEMPLITKLVIRTNLKEKIIIPVDIFLKINQRIVIKKDYSVTSLSENELYLVKNLLDKQIIDLSGNKIVRVNDVAIQKEGKKWYVMGVDVGFLGILRWLKLENLIVQILTFFRIRLKSKFLPWTDIHPLELIRGQVKLKKEEKRLEKLAPEDLADHLEKINLANTRKILRLLDENFAAQVISSLNVNYQIGLFRHFQPERAAKIINLIDSDEAVDILLSLSKKKREEILDFLEDKKRKELLYLIDFSKTPIGGLLTTEFITVSSSTTVKETIEKIKKETIDFCSLYYVYVVNEKNQLIGVFNLHELLVQEIDIPVYRFMIQNLVVIHLTTPKELAIKKMLKYKIIALPVIDDKKKILGIVAFDDLSEHLL